MRPRPGSDPLSRPEPLERIAAAEAERLAAARDLLRQAVPAPDPLGRGARVSRALAASAPRAQGRLRVLAVAAAMAGGGALFFARSAAHQAPAQRSAEPTRRVRLAGGEELSRAGARIRALADAELRMPEAPALSPLELLGGAAEIDALDWRGPSLEVVLPGGGTLSLLGARVQVRGEGPAHSEVELLQGSASCCGGAERLTLTPGQRISVRDARPEPVASAAAEPAPREPEPAAVVLRAPAERAVARRPASPPPDPQASRPPTPAEVESAEALLGSDPAAARTAAEQLLAARPEPALEVRVLCLLGDAQRRLEDRPAAAETYRRLALHPAGAAYLEEALYRRARLLVEEGAPAEAERVLADAHTRIAEGSLAPERARLWLELLLDRGAHQQALERLADPRIGTLTAADPARLRLARALLGSDPQAARAVALGVHSRELEGEASALVAEAERGSR